MLSWLFGSKTPAGPDPELARRFLAAEQTLRALHGDGSLYVRPSLYDQGGRVFAVAGWAFLDGEPAIVPQGLSILVFTWTDAAGAPVTLGRDPAAALAVLGDRVRAHTAPLPHHTVTVADADKPALFERIAALPEAPRP